jgi:hypothetical protein
MKKLAIILLLAIVACNQKKEATAPALPNAGASRFYTC